MRQTYAHVAELDGLDGLDGIDERAPGGAVTLALCGGWEHDGPCPLAPHHTAVERVDGVLRVRVLLAAAPDDEPRVRALVHEALAAGRLVGPDGRTSSWRLLHDGPAPVEPGEVEHAERLRQSGS